MTSFDPPMRDNKLHYRPDTNPICQPFLALECKTKSGPEPNKPCVFPFTFQGK